MALNTIKQTNKQYNIFVQSTGIFFTRANVTNLPQVRLASLRMIDVHVHTDATPLIQSTGILFTRANVTNLPQVRLASLRVIDVHVHTDATPLTLNV